MDGNENDRLYGWTGRDGTVASLIIRYAGPGEGWSLCPDADLPQDQWPALPVADDDAFGAAVREHLKAGTVADLTPLLAATRNIVFWVPWTEGLGGIFAVLAAIPPEPCGYVLPRARFAHHLALRSGAVPPPLDVLLADSRRVDTGPRFASAPA